MLLVVLLDNIEIAVGEDGISSGNVILALDMYSILELLGK